MSVGPLDPGIMRSVSKGRAVTVAMVMARHTVSMRVAFLALANLERQGRLVRFGGTRHEPFLWTKP